MTMRDAMRLVRWSCVAGLLMAGTGCAGSTEPDPDELMLVAVFGSGTGNGTVTVTPAGIACTIVAGQAGDSCGAAVAVGAEVVLKAVPAGGHAFAGWGDDCAAVAGPSCTLRADAPLSVVAAFQPLAELPVDHLTLDRSQVRLGLGTSTQLVARVFAAGGVELEGRAVTWTSSAPAVATVDPNGHVTPLGSGTATITAASGEKTASATIEVPPLIRHDLGDANGSALPAVVELIRVVDDQGREVDVRTTATAGWLQVDTTTNWYRQRIFYRIEVRFVTVPESEWEFDSNGAWGDHGRVVFDATDRGRFVSEYLENYTATFVRGETAFTVAQTLLLFPKAVDFGFVRR